VVMTGSGRFVEIQGTGEEATFSETELAAMLKLARAGLEQIRAIQAAALGQAWPFVANGK
jgi:ribonuclease PH